VLLVVSTCESEIFLVNLNNNLNNRMVGNAYLTLNRVLSNTNETEIHMIDTLVDVFLETITSLKV